jgi:NAD(P)H-nitrite reductase large subunit
MPQYKYLIVDGGMTADAAVRGIREVDPSGSIGVIASEPHPPYSRPPLSKALWKGAGPDSVWLKTESLAVELHLGRSARELDPGARSVTVDQRAVYHYEKLLLATGGTPRCIPSAASLSENGTARSSCGAERRAADHQRQVYLRGGQERHWRIPGADPTVGAGDATQRGGS